jgi:hypothetical protein
MAGATVWAGAVGQTDYSENDGTIKRQITGDDGAFTFDLALVEGMPAFAFVRVKAGNYAVEDTVIKPGGKIIKLNPPTTVRGIVKDAKGEPVADAAVHAVFTPGSIESLENELAAGGQILFVSLMLSKRAAAPMASGV